MAWDFDTLFSGKTIPWLSGATGLLQTPQLQSTLKSVTSIIPSAGSTILVPAGVVSRSIYDTGRFLSGSYGNVNTNINQFNPMVASAAKSYQPQTALNFSGFKLTPYPPSTPSSPPPVYVNYPYVSSNTGSILSRSGSSTLKLPSLGSYVFGNGLGILLPWSKPKTRKQKYSKRKKQQRRCVTKRRSRK